MCSANSDNKLFYSYRCIPLDRPQSGAIIHGIAGFDSVSFIHVSRSANQAAEIVANSRAIVLVQCGVMRLRIESKPSM